MAKFTPSTNFDPSNEKDWAANLGMLDWDNTSIVFTKRSLIDFLKYAGITADPNFSNIQKLPRFAEFGKVEDLRSSTDNSDTTSPTPLPAAAPVVHATGGFKPSRRVRTVPGGVQTINLFGEDDEASNFPPPKTSTAFVETSEPPDSLEPDSGPSVDGPQEADGGHAGFKPSRRVRERPGGADHIEDIFADDAPEAFKPSRRVRTKPGGESSGLW